MEKKKEFLVYIVRCEDDSLYTGITTDIRQRMYDHYYKTEKGAKYTRSHSITEIMMVWEAAAYASAARLEYAVKQLSRAKKLQLIAEPEQHWDDFFPKLAEETYHARTEYVMRVELFLQFTQNTQKRK